LFPFLAVTYGIRSIKFLEGEERLADGLYQVTTPYLCAGFVVENKVIVRCAPILRKKIDYWIRKAERISD
jgi:hypothetical protein